MSFKQLAQNNILKVKVNNIMKIFHGNHMLEILKSEIVCDSHVTDQMTSFRSSSNLKGKKYIYFFNLISQRTREYTRRKLTKCYKIKKVYVLQVLHSMKKEVLKTQNVENKSYLEILSNNISQYVGQFRLGIITYTNLEKN